MDEASASPERRRGDRLLVGGVLAVFAVVAVAHVRAYFFLLDDFVLLGEASRRSVHTIVATPLFNFYRPAEHLWLKLLRAVFGWSAPAGYAACSIALHCACAALVFRASRQFGLARASALVGAALFLLSPWATEPYLWVSGGFDLLSTTGIFAALILGLVVVDENRTRAFAAGAAGCAAAVIALLAKETGVLLPGVFLATVLLVRGGRPLLRARALAYLGALVLLTLGYLLVRQRLVPDFGSGYGTLRSLFGRGDAAANARTYARALVLWPLPSRLAADRVLPWAFGAALALAALRLVLARWRLTLLGVVSMAASIALVVWVPLGARISSGNRFLYFAGAWFSILIAAGVERFGRAWRFLLAATLLAASLVSVVYQAAIWRRASALSRATIDQMTRYAGTSQPVFVMNLARQFVQGPYIINGLAFRYYFDGNFPPMAAHEMAVLWQRDANVFAFWFDDRTPDPWARAVTLRLPVWMDESKALLHVDSPPPGASVTQPFTIRGWAIDDEAQAGTGIDSVRVYAWLSTGSENESTWLGQARYGEPRAGVARDHGAQFERSGFALEVSGLRPGTYTVRVYARSTGSRKSVSADVGGVRVVR